MVESVVDSVESGVQGQCVQQVGQATVRGNTAAVLAVNSQINEVSPLTYGSGRPEPYDIVVFVDFGTTAGALRKRL